MGFIPEGEEKLNHILKLAESCFYVKKYGDMTSEERKVESEAMELSAKLNGENMAAYLRIEEAFQKGRNLIREKKLEEQKKREREKERLIENLLSETGGDYKKAYLLAGERRPDLFEIERG